MVYTLTLNPAIDYVVSLEKLNTGGINRALTEDAVVGGKGINVSLVLRELGIESCAMGFLAGFTGDKILSSLKEKGIACGFIRLDSGFTRINLKVKADEELEINGRGPEIPAEKLCELLALFDGLGDGDTVVLSGSIPKSVPSDIYAEILLRLEGKNVRTVIDTSGDALRATLKYKPYLVKPNIHELGELFSVELKGKGECERYAKKLMSLGARNVLLSLGKDGSMLFSENGRIYTMGVCRGTVKSSVGAGDSMLAGYLTGILTGRGEEYSLSLGTAAGGAAAFRAGLPTKDEIEKLLSEL